MIQRLRNFLLSLDTSLGETSSYRECITEILKLEKLPELQTNTYKVKFLKKENTVVSQRYFLTSIIIDPILMPFFQKDLQKANI